MKPCLDGDQVCKLQGLKCLDGSEVLRPPALMLSLLVITAAHGMHMLGMSARVAQTHALKKATINQAKVHVIYCGTIEATIE